MNASQTRTPQRERAAKKTKEHASPECFVRKVLLAYLLTIAGAIPILLVCTLIAYFTPDPNTYVLPLGLLAAALSALLGGGVAIRLHQKNLLVVTLLNAGLMTVTMLLLSFGFRSHATGYASWLSALLHLGYFLLSVAGAWIMAPRERKTKKKRKNAKKR